MAGQAEDEEPPAKMKKLAIVEEREEDKYEYITTIKCWYCDNLKGLELPEAVSDSSVCSIQLAEEISLTTALGQSTGRQRDAIHVFSTSVRSESMGRRAPPLRTHVDSGADRNRSYPGFR
jgi:hypothetical protein